MKLMITVGLALSLSLPALADVVEFHIPAGTGTKAWNTSATSIQARIGDSILFVNDDSTVHRLHTNGAPCPHGPSFGPTQKWECKVTQAFSSATAGPLYDHNAGETAEVWIEAN